MNLIEFFSKMKKEKKKDTRKVPSVTVVQLWFTDGTLQGPFFFPLELSDTTLEEKKKS